MIKKIFSLLIGLLLLVTTSLKADEGLWLPFLIEKMGVGTMTEMGLKLSPEEIYSVNKASIKDAIVALDHGSCTAEVISKNGLILTNHHCGYGEIQEHSSEQHDYLTNGFSAKTKADELPNPGKTATFLIRIENVTEKINGELNDDMTESERQAAIDRISKKLEAQAVGNSHYEASVENFFKGNFFYLFVYETFKDVRLVFAPPESIGKFGGDTDNWMWPRHTGDFSIFRIYSGPDGKPAEYSDNNIPFQPKYSLPISLKGVEKQDFAMVWGYPGTTKRYLTSWGVKNEINNVNKVRIKVRGVKLDLMKEDMEKSNKIRIQYASKYARSSNYWKYSIGQNKGLAALNVIEKKQKLQEKFTKWLNNSEERKQKYGNALELIKKAYIQMDHYNHAINYWFEALYSGPEALSFSLNAMMLNRVYQQMPSNENAINKEIEVLREAGKDYFKDYNPPTDKKIMAAMFKVYYENVPESFHPSFFTVVEDMFDGDFASYVDYMFENSIFTNQERFEEFIDRPNHEIVFHDNDILSFAAISIELYNLLENDSENKQAVTNIIEQLQEAKDIYFSGFNAEKEKEKFASSFEQFYKAVPKHHRPEVFELIENKYKGKINEFAEDMFKKSMFADKEQLEKFLNKPKAKKMEKDLAFLASKSIYSKLRSTTLSEDPVFNSMMQVISIYQTIQGDVEEYQLNMKRGQRKFVDGLLKMQKDKAMYPDANSTMRFTYGTVGNYEPRDGVIYKHYTTLEGVMEKKDPDSDEFVVPDKLEALFLKKDYGRYADDDGYMPVCFTTNNDITGGNSGSPVLNGEGHLIGVAFDGNWEAMSGDIAFEPELQKCINVDIRYVLFIIDKFFNADHLIKEMEIIE